MKKIFDRIIKAFCSVKIGRVESPRDLRRDAEHFARKMGPAIKQLSKE